MNAKVLLGATVAAALFVSLATAAGARAPQAQRASASGSIVVSGFGSATDDEAYKDFYKPWSERSGIAVTLDDASQDIVPKLQAAAAAGRVIWSLARADEDDATVLAQRGLLQPLPARLQENLRKFTYPGGVTRYGVAFADFTTVLICNPKLVARCPTTPRQFFDTKSFPGPRTMYADGWIENLVLALEADGVSPGKLFPLDVDRAFRKLDTIRNSIHVWWNNAGQDEQVFRDGEVAIGTGYSSRASLLADSGMRVSYAGSVANRELLVIPKGAPNPQAAYSLMLWYASHPRQQAAFMAARRMALSNPRALRYLPRSITATISTAPQNMRQSVHIDFGWVRQNRESVFRRWQTWLTR